MGQNTFSIGDFLCRKIELNTFENDLNKGGFIDIRQITGIIQIRVSCLSIATQPLNNNYIFNINFTVYTKLETDSFYLILIIHKIFYIPFYIHTFFYRLLLIDFPHQYFHN